MRLEENVERHLRHFCLAIWPSKNLTRGKLLEKILTRKYRYRILKIGKMSLSIQYSFFIPILGTSLHFSSMISIEPEKDTLYHTNCGVIQWFPALRKAATTRVKKYRFSHFLSFSFLRAKKQTLGNNFIFLLYLFSCPFTYLNRVLKNWSWLNNYS